MSSISSTGSDLLQQRCLPRSFDSEKMQLNLDGVVVNVYTFSDDPEAPWFQAKPIATYLEYTQVTYAMGHVDCEDKMSLQELFDTKGTPLGGGGDSLSHNEGKALYITEAGLYSLIFRSNKLEAKVFSKWVRKEVLPSLRRTLNVDSSKLPTTFLGEDDGGERATLSAHRDLETLKHKRRSDGKPEELARRRRLEAVVAATLGNGEEETKLSFATLVKQTLCGTQCQDIPAALVVSASRLKEMTRLAYATFISLVARDEQRSVDSVGAELQDASFGLKAKLPEKWKELAVAAVDSVISRGPFFPSSAIPAGDVERDGVSLLASLAALSSQGDRRKSKTAFVAEEKAHSAAKDAANSRWLHMLKKGGRFFFLDSWCQKEGFQLRTVGALLRAGHEAGNLFSANPDEAIVKQLRREGVTAHHGSWAESPFRSYDGIYLDLCSGSESYLRLQLEIATSRSNPSCVLAWTLTERDFAGEPLLLRAFGVNDFLLSLGWRPGMKEQKPSAMLHRSGGSGQQVLTEFWIKG